MTDIYFTFPSHMRDLHYGPGPLGELRTLGRVHLNEEARNMSARELAERARECEIIVLDRLTPANEELFANAPKLKAVCRRSVDIRNIDIPAASRHGILITHAIPGFIPAVAELVVAQMVNLARRLPEQVMEYRAGRVPKLAMGVQVSGKTAGIVGFGQIARHLAGILAAMRMRVLAHDPYVTDFPAGVEACGMDRLLGESDFVICLALHTPETENLMNAAVFARMKRTAYFVNVSRGGLVDEAALEAALTAGQIAGAVLDVGRAASGEEAGDVPPVSLGRLPNVVATPHSGALVPDSMLAQSYCTVEQVRDILAGVMPRAALNGPHATRLKLRPRPAED